MQLLVSSANKAQISTKVSEIQGEARDPLRLFSGPGLGSSLAPKRAIKREYIALKVGENRMAWHTSVEQPKID